MDPGPSSSSGVNKQWVCVCRRYCGGQPHLLPKVTFYWHLNAVEEDEYHKIIALRAVMLEAAHTMLAYSRNPLGDNLPVESGPSTGISPAAHQAAIQQALVKGAWESPESQ